MASPETIFKELFSAEYSKLCRYALTYMQDEHAAEDVVQDTFIRIWETRRELITSPDIRYYLVTAVRNNCISALRKQKSNKLRFPENAPEGEAEPFLTSMQHHQEAEERSSRLSKALDTLPPKCREVFLMTKMQGLSYRQVAEGLGISIKTVENQMGKALKMLRENTVLSAILLISSAAFVNQAYAIGVWLTKNVLF